jgi:glycosyltransferase involved in cell wall biosynthesis
MTTRQQRESDSPILNPSMPRIAVVFEFSTLNGGERSMLSVLDSLRRQEQYFEFFAIGPSVGRLAEALAERGICLIGWSPTHESGLRRATHEIEASFLSAIQSIKPDLVHANSLAMSRLLGRLSGSLEIPTTGHLRDIIKLSAAAIADLNRNRSLVAVSDATRVFHVGQGIEPNRISVVRNGIDLDRFRPRAPTGWLHSELGLERTAILITCIGQIGLRKGQDVLAAAAPEIVKQVPEAHFLLIGERTSQKAESIQFEQTIHQRFAELGLADRLHMLGYRDDVADVLGEVDLLVHPANQEPFGRVLLEASAAGVPIVATNVGGTSEIVIDRTTGHLVPPRDPRALAQAVIAVLTNKMESKRFRENGRSRAESEFEITHAAKRLKSVWDNVLK